MTGPARRPIYGVIAAAGASRRMGQPKLLMDYRGQAVIDRVLTALLDGGVSRVAVVGRAIVRAHLAGRVDGRTVCVANDEPESTMIDSVRLGLSHWRRCADAPNDQGYLITPGDLPALTAGDVQACVDAAVRQPDALIIGCHGGRRGHPLVVPSSLVDEVLGAACATGLNALARVHADRVVVVDTPTCGSVRDMNTPADFENLDH